MQEGQLLMTQADRDRLVTLKKAKKKLITQREAAGELGISTRQVKRLLYALKKRGDKAVVHGLRGRPSQRRISESVEKEAVKILSADLDRGAFSPGERARGAEFRNRPGSAGQRHAGGRGEDHRPSQRVSD